MSRYIDIDKLQENICARVTDPATRRWLNALINEQPLADVKEVKHGQWSCYRISEDYIYIKYACSQCHYTNQYATDFCPHCGAQMEEESVKE